MTPVRDGREVVDPLKIKGMDRPPRLDVDLDYTDELENDIANYLDVLAPEGCRRIDLHVAMLVGELQMRIAVLLENGEQVVPEIADPDVLTVFRETLTDLRRAFYQPGGGTWFQMRLMLDYPSDRYDVSYDFRCEPEWNPPVRSEKYAEDFDAFPRSEWYLPPWLREHLDRARPGGWKPAPNPGLHPSLEQLYERRELVDRLSHRLGQTMPSGAQHLTIWHRAVGDHVEVETDLLDIFGTSVEWRPPEDVFVLLNALRKVLYREDRGTWFTARLQMPDITRVDFDWNDVDEPAWDIPPSEEAYQEELRRFPRAPEYIPAWLARKAGLEDDDGSGGDVELRLARTNDGLIPLPGHPAGGLPTFSDRPIPSPEERRAMQSYLEGAPVVATLEGTDVDLFQPEAPGVARVYRTDGIWVWSELVVHYLRERGIAPERELFEHARANDFQFPEVGEDVRAAAASFVAASEVEG